ncbi:hypothetical protein CA54_38370 [Symmachiella macrocystis]|uniref:Uncharacterized protein n=1 Tax=Symmachiella macrocystis TaxID=2527985 RepID=A0A5C6BTH6_9PLAN|nr:hypothetical protein CA54_38370 [Symmachiella macrocystis]
MGYCGNSEPIRPLLGLLFMWFFANNEELTHIAKPILKLRNGFRFIFHLPTT